MSFQDKVVVITGGAKGIGRALVEAYQNQGAKVAYIDILDNPCFVGGLAKKEDLEAFSKYVIDTYGKVDILIHNAKPAMIGIDDCSYEQFVEALNVGVTAGFYLTKLFLPYFQPGASIVNISSSRDRMSQRQTESYTAAKGGIAALTHALAVSLQGNVRVNSVSPGWIDTQNQIHSKSDEVQHLVKRVGRVEDIVHTVMFLTDDKSSFITGENIVVDGGMTHVMIYHGDHGWKYQP